MVYSPTAEAKAAEAKKLLEKKDADVEEMKKRLKEQERERQSELLKLQMEVNKNLHWGKSGEPCIVIHKKAVV